MEINIFSNRIIIKDKSGKFKTCGLNKCNCLYIDSKEPSQLVLADMLIEPKDVKQIAGGYGHTIFLMKDGTLKCIGYNYNGQLGLGHTTDVLELTDIPGITGVKNVYCGEYITIIALEDGTVMGCGSNGYGQLGLGHTNNVTSFTKLSISNVKQVSCGSSHTMVLLEDGTLKGAGYDRYGQLGDGYATQYNRTSFYVISTSVIDDKIKKIETGYDYTVLLTESNLVYGVGSNSNGQLGLGSINQQLVFKQLYDNPVKDVRCGSAHTVILTEDGKVYTTGRNNNGQLGLKNNTYKYIFTEVDYINTVKKIYAGQNTTFVELKNSELYGTGDGTNGQLGASVQSTSEFSPIIDLYDVDSILCGTNNSFIISKNGDLKVVGYNQYGQLGLGDSIYNDVASFTKVNNIRCKEIFSGDYHTILLTPNNTLKATGSNGHGQLGLGHNEDIKEFIDIPGIKNVKDVACGSNHTLVLLNDGRLLGTGSNSPGQLGLGDINKVNNFNEILPYIPNIKSIRCHRYYSSVLLLEDGTIMVSGYNNFGQLGLGDTQHFNTFTKVDNVSNVKDVACGYLHTVLLLEDGTIMVSGYNNSGQIGLGKSINGINMFTKIDGIIGVKKVVCGNYFTMLLMEDGTVKACGYNYYGELGLGDNNTRYTFEDIPGMINIKQISCGAFHTLFLDYDNYVYSVGYNNHYQNGIKTTNTPIKLPYLQRSIVKYLLNNNDKYYTLEDIDKLVELDGIDFEQAILKINNYKNHIGDGYKVIKYKE